MLGNTQAQAAGTSLILLSWMVCDTIFNNLIMDFLFVSTLIEMLSLVTWLKQVTESLMPLNVVSKLPFELMG